MKSTILFSSSPNLRYFNSIPPFPRKSNRFLRGGKAVLPKVTLKKEKYGESPFIRLTFFVHL